MIQDGGGPDVLEYIYIEPHDSHMVRFNGKNIAEDNALDARDTVMAIAAALKLKFRDVTLDYVPEDSGGYYKGVNDV